MCRKFAFTACPETCPHWASTEAASAAASATLKPGGASPHIYRGTLASMRHIARTEGVSQLWRGTDMALLMAVPMVGIYMPLYDYTRGTLQPELGTSLAPLAAGALSRTAAVLCTAPLDLLRTRMQVTMLPFPYLSGTSPSLLNWAVPSCMTGRLYHPMPFMLCRHGLRCQASVNAPGFWMPPVHLAVCIVQDTRAESCQLLAGWWSDSARRSSCI